MRKISVVAVFWAVVIFAGGSGSVSAAPYFPGNFALSEPAHGISLLHPDEVERAGVNAITVSAILFNPELYVEATEGGGVWQIVGINQKETLRGSAYLAGLNPWGDYFARCELLYDLTRIGGTKFILLSRDGKVAFNLSGQRLIEFQDKKFNQDSKYRLEFIEKGGMSLSELDKFWREYLAERAITLPTGQSLTSEIKLFSPAWSEYKAKLLQLMQHAYKDSGEMRVSFVGDEQYKDISSEIMTFKSGKRVLKNGYLPLSPLVMLIAGVSVPWVAATGLGASAIHALIDDHWVGNFWYANTTRGGLSGNFLTMSMQYRQVIADNARRSEEKLRAKDNEIEKLRTELENLKQGR